MASRLPVIAHVLHRLYLAGAEVLAADLARQLRNRYNFVFACLDEAGPLGQLLSDEGFVVEAMDRKPGVDFTCASHLRTFFKKHNVDLVHAHQYSPFFYAANARGFWGTALSRPPILFTEHGRHYPDFRSPKRVIANKFMVTRNDRVTAVGEFIKDALVKNEGIPAKRIEVIYNGIDPAKFDVALNADGDRMRAQVRERLRIEPDRPVILQVARLHPVKDHVTSIAAMGYVVRDVPDALLLLAGDGVERERILGAAESVGVTKNIRLLGVRDDVPELMAATDVFVLSSLSEGVSVTLLEAMASAKPIAATEVGGNGEVVSHGATGLLSPRGNAKSLGKNLVTLLRNPKLCVQMGKAGRDRVVKQFHQRDMHAEYAKRYQQMLR